jgi:hypothetical protein
MRYLRSWLQSVSRIRSFHSHRMNSEGATHHTFPRVITGKIGSPVTIRQPQVTWPDGRRAAGAPICVAYEHTENFARLSTVSWIKNTDQSGFGVIHVYGNSRVRVSAAQYVENEKTKQTDAYFSHPVEAAADKVPENIQLVLTSPQP